MGGAAAEKELDEGDEVETHWSRAFWRPEALAACSLPRIGKRKKDAEILCSALRVAP